MKLAFNIIKWSLAILGAIVIVLFSLSWFLSDKVVEVFLRSLNSEISTKIEAGEYRFSLMKKFPKASVELRNVIVWSSPTFDKTQFSGNNCDTLLSAEAVFLEFSMTDIIKENYNIDRIAVDNGRMNILSDSSGNVNYEFTSDSSSSDDDSFVINLERINARSVYARYINTATSFDISGMISTGSFKSRIAGDNLDFNCNAQLIIQKVAIDSTDAAPDASVTLDLNLHESDSGIVFKKGSMKLENFRFELSGSISSENIMDLRITGQDIELSRIKKYLPDEFLDKYNSYSPSGILKSECLIFGLVSRKQNPGIDLHFSVEDGSVRYARSNIGIKELSVSGRFTNGESHSPETWLIDIEHAGFVIGSTHWSGSFSLTDITDPLIDMTFSGEIKPEELLRFFPAPDIVSAEGSVRLNLNLSGKPGKDTTFSVSDIVDLHPEADMAFNSFSLTHKDDRWSVKDADGNIMIARNIWAEDLVFTYMNHRFRVNGEFANLPAWLAGRRVKLKIDAEISAGNFEPEVFLGNTSQAGETGKRAFTLPADIEAKIRFKTDNLVYKTFTAEKLSGNLHFRRGVIDMSDLSINALGGSAKGEFYLAQSKEKSFLSHGDFTFDGIDITKTFTAFRNFGQDFLKAENIAGSLSGNLTLLMRLDSLLNPDIKTVTAEGRYIIENGALKNFEPVKALSGFIELSELENITFSKLENDLFIRNNYLAVPQMDIASSAADFSINGKHYFDGKFEYHVKVYLSEILSKKARNNSRYSTEFGPVEEDGLGRTSVFLKLSGNSDDIKVTPDSLATRNNIKQSLRKEKGNLKNILNEEYGWFKSDTTVKPGTGSKPKFRIRFEETDTTSVETDTVETDVKRGLNRIFRKKKGSEQ